MTDSIVIQEIKETVQIQGGEAVAVTTSFPLAPGLNTQVVFNDGGQFGSSADLTFDKTLKKFVLAQDVCLFRDAAGVLAQRNGTSPQGLRVYNTFTDASNYERIEAGWNTNIAVLGARAAGTGAFRGTRVYGSTIAFFTGVSDGAAASRWTIDVNGHWVASADNSFDIGASGATRPRALYVAGAGTFGATVSSTGSGFLGAAGGSTGWSGRSLMSSGADGVIVLQNNALTDFGRLQFGGTSSSFPALKRSAAELHVRLADDSADTPLQALKFKVATLDVVGARKTGWGAPTGTATRTTFDTGTVTLVQLAERVKALLDDLTSHGLVGA